MIGLPGDTIQMKEGELYINDQEVPRKRIEDYLYQEDDGAVIPMQQYIETLPERPRSTGSSKSAMTGRSTTPCNTMFRRATIS